MAPPRHSLSPQHSQRRVLTPAWNMRRLRWLRLRRGPRDEELLEWDRSRARRDRPRRIAACQVSFLKAELGAPRGYAVAFFVACRQSRAGGMKGFTPVTRSRTRRGRNGNVSEWVGAVEGLALQAGAPVMRPVQRGGKVVDIETALVAPAF